MQLVDEKGDMGETTPFAGLFVTVTADTPVLDIFKPVTKTSFTNAFRDPIDSIVICDQVIFNFCHLDEL